MNDLLESAVAAHGGLDRWNQVKSITVDASITGALWALKSKGDALKDVRFEVDTTRERLTMDFAGQALWTYLNTPFLYTWPGFVTEEIAPIEVGGETWRRLKVTFPDHIKSHTRQQISCFGPDGLLRRHDFTIDILGGATGLLYATGYRDVAGVIIPATRRGYAWQGDYQLVPEPLLVAIDMGEITIR